MLLISTYGAYYSQSFQWTHVIVDIILDSTGIDDLIKIIFKNPILIPFYKYFNIITFLDITVMISFNVCII